MTNEETTMIYALAEHGTALSTRPLGGDLRTRLLEQVSPDEAVTLDFDGILAVSYSFADEFAGRLAEDAAAGVIASFEVVNAREEVTRMLNRAIDRRRSALAAS